MKKTLVLGVVFASLMTISAAPAHADDGNWWSCMISKTKLFHQQGYSWGAAAGMAYGQC